jgi:hypothetical protein
MTTNRPLKDRLETVLSRGFSDEERQRVLAVIEADEVKTQEEVERILRAMRDRGILRPDEDADSKTKGQRELVALAERAEAAGAHGHAQLARELAGAPNEVARILADRRKRSRR